MEHQGASAPFIVFLSVVASLASFLAMFQWAELVHAQDGGTPLCAISETFDCRTVWSSDLAKGVHRWTRLPIAGWGLLWGIVGLGSALLAWVHRQDLAGARRAIASLRLTALVGVAVCLILFGVSAVMGVYCVTCVGTYALVIAFAVVAFKLPRPKLLSREDWLGALGRTAALLVLGYVVLLYPALRTSVGASPWTGARARPEPGKVTRDASTPPGPSEDPLTAFLADLAPAAKQAVSDSILAFRESLPRDTSRWPARKRYGAGAALRIVEFSDIRCVHCRAFSETMREIETGSPEGVYSLELRQFPLDSTCNPTVPREIRDESGVRCTAAKALICVEPTDRFREAQEEMFRDQDRLSVARILEIASSAGMSARDLERCVQSSETAAKLSADIEFATSFDIDGTPLVIINDRRASTLGPFLYGLILSGGDLGATAWRALPAPRMGSGR